MTVVDAAGRGEMRVLVLGGWEAVVIDEDAVVKCGFGVWLFVLLLLLMPVGPRVLWRMSFSRARMCREDVVDVPYGGWRRGSSVVLGWRGGAIVGRGCGWLVGADNGVVLRASTLSRLPFGRDDVSKDADSICEYSSIPRRERI